MNTNLLPVTIEIKAEWQEIAYNFATEQHQEQQQLEIFQNTLAVLGLQEYLQWGEIETALTSSYSWHPYSRILTGWADLLLPEYGRLLCCLKQEQNCVELPAILPINCFGCVVFELVPDASSLQLQGFIPRRLLDLDRQIELNYVSLEEMGAIASLFDELYLLTEERLLVEQEILQLSATDEDLEAYFSSLLDSENIIDIVGRLNRLFYESKTEPKNNLENIFITDEINEQTSERISTSSLVDLPSAINYLPVLRENTDFYSINAPQQKITEITQALTEKLLVKIRQLRDDL